MSKTLSGMSQLAIEAGFGTRVWSYYGYLAAKYFHPLVATFVILILYISTAPYLPPGVGLLPLFIYLAYYVLRHLLPASLNARFYSPVVQFFRAQLGIWGLFGFTWLTSALPHRTDLWILYLPSLLIIGRHCPTPIFILSVAQACLMIIMVRWNGDLPPIPVRDTFLVDDLDWIVPCLGLTFSAFVMHYLIRNIDARNDTIASFEAIDALSDQTSGQPLAERWQTVLETYLRLVGGVCGSLWLCDHNTRRIRPLADFRHCLETNCPIGSAYCDLGPLDLAADHPIAKAATSGQPVFCRSDRAKNEDLMGQKPMPTCTLPAGIFSRIAVPITELYADSQRTLGVLCIDFPRQTTPRQGLIQDYFEFLSGLARRVRPILYQAQQVEELHALQRLGQRVSSSLTLEMILVDAVDAVVDTLGFEFATISLVDPEQQVVEAVKGRNVPAEWIKAAVHPLDSGDIQADVIRRGQQEVLSGWDSRFDREIWEKFNHGQMIRVFTPIVSVDHAGQSYALGTIEAGYYTTTRADITEDQRRMLSAFAGQLGAAIENANLFAQTKRRAESLASLHRIGWQVALARDLKAVLDEVGNSLKTILEADIVMLYRYNRRTQQLEPPRSYGEILGDPPLRPPSPHKGIIAAILTSGQPHYSSDVHSDPLLADLASSNQADPTRMGRPTFNERQGIVSFAGVPMIADGAVVGVLCVNYRRRHTFSDNQRQVLEIAAQFAAVALHNAETNELVEELITSRERMQLATQLHHSLSQYLPAIRMMAELAEVHLNGTGDKIARQLEKIKAAANKANNEVRVNIFELNTKSLADSELLEVLEDFVREAQYFFNLEVSLRTNLASVPPLPTFVAREIVYACREGIGNTAKHATAKHLDMELQVQPQSVTLHLQDDGCGFDLAQLRTRGRRGLAMLRERIEKLNGIFYLNSQPGIGTLIQVELPLANEEE